MLGAVAGDIIGSCWEGSSCPDLPLPLITEQSVFTDDSVCTIAVADALLRGVPFEQALREWVPRYPNRGYGGKFYTWAHSANAPPYSSFSNGGAMRVSPVGLLAKSAEEALKLAEMTARVSHNHPDGMTGARAIALAIWYARSGYEPEDIRDRIQRISGWSLAGSVEHRASTYGFSTLASETVPDALVSALEANSFEGAIRNAIAIGGDSDTLACMAGGIAEALFGIPDDLAAGIQAELPAEMLSVLEQLYARAELPFPLKGTRPQVSPQPRQSQQSAFGRMTARFRSSR
jgi:ADP-ribosyl-[dinitrogen reductase] hydrolase